MKPMNKEQALALFEKEAFFTGNFDGVSVKRAEELLGKAAVAYAFKLGETGNAFYINNYDNPLKYLNRTGFMKAVSYYNAKIIIGQEATVV